MSSIQSDVPDIAEPAPIFGLPNEVIDMILDIAADSDGPRAAPCGRTARSTQVFVFARVCRRFRDLTTQIHWTNVIDMRHTPEEMHALIDRTAKPILRSQPGFSFNPALELLFINFAQAHADRIWALGVSTGLTDMMNLIQTGFLTLEHLDVTQDSGEDLALTIAPDRLPALKTLRLSNFSNLILEPPQQVWSLCVLELDRPCIVDTLLDCLLHCPFLHTLSVIIAPAQDMHHAREMIALPQLRVVKVQGSNEAIARLTTYVVPGNELFSVTLGKDIFHFQGDVQDQPYAYGPSPPFAAAWLPSAPTDTRIIIRLHPDLSLRYTFTITAPPTMPLYMSGWPPIAPCRSHKIEFRLVPHNNVLAWVDFVNASRPGFSIQLQDAKCGAAGAFGWGIGVGPHIWAGDQEHHAPGFIADNEAIEILAAASAAGRIAFTADERSTRNRVMGVVRLLVTQQPEGGLLCPQAPSAQIMRYRNGWATQEYPGEEYALFAVDVYGHLGQDMGRPLQLVVVEDGTYIPIGVSADPAGVV